MTPDALHYEWLGQIAYGDALQFQRRLHAAVRARQAPPTVLALEHPPTITTGKRTAQAELRCSEEHLRDCGIALFRTDRGGLATAHEPGQLVVYPIVPLPVFRLNIRSYVRLLEQTVIETLGEFGIAAAVDPERPGVWVGEKKICSVGIRVAQRVSTHGLALNVSNDCRTFGLIVPCGLQRVSMTSMAAEGCAAGIAPTPQTVAQQLFVRLNRQFRSLANPERASPESRTIVSPQGSL